MTDIDFHGKNKISGYSIKMKVKNVEHFSPEVQQAFKDLMRATEYPKQSTIEEWEGKKNDRGIETMSVLRVGYRQICIDGSSANLHRGMS